MRLFPQRRWLRFSIRTLLVAVTIFCVWLGWNCRIVQERKAAMKLIESSGGSVNVREPFHSPAAYPPDVSWIRNVLGDESKYAFYVPASMSDEERTRVVQAFPEANVTIVPDARLRLSP